jgi:ABC-2 type transport system ATP-binding protein
MRAGLEAIRVAKLWVGFRVGFWGKRFFALKEVSLGLEKGKTYALIGPNGAGKSTLIRAMLGFLKPTKGTLAILGGSPKEAVLSGKIGYTPENPGLYPHLKGLETLMLAGSLLKLGKITARTQAMRLIERLGLLGHETREVKGYSKGMQQRLALGFSLMGTPELLIWDEPMSGLDPIGRGVVRNLMAELKSEGRTLVFSTHIIPDIEETCDAIVLIDKGKKISEFSPKAFLEESTRGYILKGLGQLAPNGLGADVRVLEGQEGGWALEVPKGSLGETINRLTQTGGAIETLEPIRPSLEELLVERFLNHG